MKCKHKVKPGSGAHPARARLTDQSLLQGHDGAVQLALHAQDVLSHRGHVELKPRQLSLVILQV